MRHFFPVVLVLLLTSSAGVAVAKTVRTFEREFEADGLGSLRLDVPVGKIEVQGASTDRIVVEVRIRCDRGDERCAERAERVELDSRERGDQLRLEFDGLRGWNDRDDLTLDVRVEVPATIELELELGVGDVRVSDTENHVYIDVGVGEAQVRMREGVVRSVDLDVGIGDAELWPRVERSRSRNMLGRDLRWRDGEGEARIAIDVGVGEAAVRLR